MLRSNFVHSDIAAKVLALLKLFRLDQVAVIKSAKMNQLLSHPAAHLTAEAVAFFSIMVMSQCLLSTASPIEVFEERSPDNDDDDVMMDFDDDIPQSEMLQRCTNVVNEMFKPSEEKSSDVRLMDRDVSWDTEHTELVAIITENVEKLATRAVDHGDVEVSSY